MKNLRLAKDIYDGEEIESACRVYSGYASIMVMEQKDAFILEFRNCKYDEDQTIKEFENYLIGLENQ